jgi:serine/threonine protein kinase
MSLLICQNKKSFLKRKSSTIFEDPSSLHWMERKNYFYARLFLDNINTHFHQFIFDMNISFDAKYQYTFFNLETKHSEDKIKQYFKHQKMLYTHIQTTFSPENKQRLTGSSFGKIYIDKHDPKLGEYSLLPMSDEKKLYKVFNMEGFFLEIFHEAFVGYMLHKFFPDTVPKVHEIGKFEKIISTPVKKKYIYFSQTYYSNGTYFSHFDSFTFQEHLYYLIKISEHIQMFQNTLEFIHCDLKTNNICISNDRKSVCFIDFGYSSLIYQTNIISTDLSLTYDQFVKDDIFDLFCQNRVLTQEFVRNDPHKFSGDIFYLIYSILYHHLHSPSDITRNQELYNILYPLFNVNHKRDDIINIFDEMYDLNINSFDFVGFFMSKDSTMFNYYFGNNITNIEQFYERLLPTNMISYLNRFQEKSISVNYENH